MDYVDPVVVGCISSLIIGLVLVIGGLYAKPRSRPQTRESAALLASFATVVGIITMIAGALFLIRAV